MEMKQRKREGILLLHKTRAGRGTAKSCAVIFNVGACYPSITTSQRSTYTASYGSRGTWKPVVTPATALKDQNYLFWKQPKLSHARLKLQSQRPFQYIIIYMAREVPGKARGLGWNWAATVSTTARAMPYLPSLSVAWDGNWWQWTVCTFNYRFIFWVAGLIIIQILQLNPESFIPAVVYFSFNITNIPFLQM